MFEREVGSSGWHFLAQCRPNVTRRGLYRAFLLQFRWNPSRSAKLLYCSDTGRMPMGSQPWIHSPDAPRE
eukprot:s164_g20.t1